MAGKIHWTQGENHSSSPFVSLYNLFPENSNFPYRKQANEFYMTTLTGTGHVIPAKAGCRGGSRTALTGFPHIEYGAGWVKAGMTNSRKFMSLCIEADGYRLSWRMKADINKFWRRPQAHGRPARPHPATDVQIAIPLAVETAEVREENMGNGAEG